MAKITDAAIGFIRDVFGREKQKKDLSVSTRELLQRTNQGRYPGMDVSTLGGLDEYLGLDRRLLFRFSDYEEMDEYPDIACLAGESLIFVLDRGWVEIRKLAEEGGSFNVLSYDKNTKLIVSAHALGARKTGEVGHGKKMVKVVLRDGRTITCTADHLFLTDKEEWIEAGKLEINTLLILNSLCCFSPSWNFNCDFLSGNGLQGCLPNNRVLEVDVLHEYHDVYDIEVPQFKNFICNGVVVHNSALDIYADDATQVDSSTRKTIWIESDDGEIKKDLDDLFSKRLKLEDEIWGMSRGLCIAKGTRIWGGKNKEIQNIEVGDYVLSAIGEKTKVISKVSNGIKDVVRMRTRHREVVLTKDHLVLTEDKSGERKWKKVEDFLVERWNPTPGRRTGMLHEDNTKVVFCTRFKGENAPSFSELLGGLDISGIPKNGDKGHPNNLILPDVIEPWFCRLFGFLLGDGFMVHSDVNHTVTYARGLNEDQNDYYDELLERLGLPVYVTEDGAYSKVHSIRFEKVLLALGWIDGSSNKRIPGWVYSLPEEHRNEFLWGFIDADGWTSQPKTWKRAAWHFEIANEELAYDLKSLIDGLGYRSGNIRDRKREPGFMIKGVEVKTTLSSFTLTFSTYRYDSQFVSERVVSVEDAGRVEVFDIGVESDHHSFVSAGICTHNCKYGNEFNEIIANDNGVVDLVYLPPATMRRVENEKTDLLGFVQTFEGDTYIDPKSFEQLVLDQGRGMSSQGNMAVFEDWRVVHMRLRSKHRDSLYGWPVIEAARWIWRRLLLMEDAVMYYKLCLHGDSQVWTADGCKAIRDIEEGDEIYSYTEDEKLKKSKVVYKKNNGKDVLYRIKSAHRELFANATHPILVETIIGNGKGSPRGRVLEYVETQDLIPGVHRIVTPWKDDSVGEDIPLIFPETGQKAKLSQKAISDGVKIEAGISKLQKDCGMNGLLIRKFFDGEYEVVAHTAKNVLEENGTSLDYLDIREDWGGVKKLSLPKSVTPEFARWFGFMIGDGFVSESPFTRDGRSYLVRKVGFAAGSDEETNQKYKNLFESFFGEVKFEQDKCLGNYSISSRVLYEFMLLNGFIPCAYNKRIPAWVFKASIVVRQEFLNGLIDAAGWISEGSVSGTRNRVRHKRMNVESCNGHFVNDVRELIMQLGYKVGSVTSRVGFLSLSSDYISYSVSWSEDRQPITEVIHSVEEIEADDVWDIGVDASEHNFIANGMVVHNSRSPSRYAFYIDVGNLPRPQAEREMQEVMNRVKKKKFFNNKTGHLDMRFNPLPVSHDTPIPLLDGRNITIEEMAKEFEQGKKHWVYSIDKKNGNVVPGEVEWVGKTRETSPSVRIIFEDCGWASMAPDHPVLLTDMEYVLAKDLKPGDKVVSFYGREYLGKVAQYKMVILVEESCLCDHYCMTVKKWNNFALLLRDDTGKALERSGVFVKNSFDEDFFLAVRDGKESTRVDVLNGPAYQQVEDVQYFLAKLYAALKVPKAYLGYEESLTSRATLCIAGDTKIPLLDGTNPTIKELSKRKDPFWVYSLDDNNNVVPGLARDARLTRRRTKTVNIELDSGDILTCTPDHPIMMRDGSYREARELNSGNSLMPFYKRFSNGEEKIQSLKDYEQIYDPSLGQWIYTHRMVTDCLFEEVTGNQVRHHLNFDRKDNRPENISIMNKMDHYRFHSEHITDLLMNKEIEEKRKLAHGEWLKTDSAKESIKKAALASKLPCSRFWDWVHSSRHKEMKSEQMTSQWKDPNGLMRKARTDKWRKKMSEIMQKRIANGTAPGGDGEKNGRWRSDANFDRLVEVSREYRCSSKKELIKWSGYSECLINRILSGLGISYRDFASCYMVENKMRDVVYRSGKNHKVVAVRSGPVVDTYDLTVDGYHNFATQVGVFIHNSQEDVRFCKSILRVQREERNGFRKIANVHLAARKIDPYSVDFTPVMTVPSAIFELGQMEIRRTRAEVAAMMQAHVSMYYILSNIYGFSDEEIEQITKDRKKDAKEAASMPGMGGGEGGGGGFESKDVSGVPITEKDLFKGNRQDEKRIEDKLKKILEQRDNKLGNQVRQTGVFVREILDTMRERKK